MRDHAQMKMNVNESRHDKVAIDVDHLTAHRAQHRLDGSRGLVGEKTHNLAASNHDVACLNRLGSANHSVLWSQVTREKHDKGGGMCEVSSKGASRK